jgi:hypothetical protein
VLIDEKDYLAHYGILRRSGRYPWGSGSNPQRNRRFLDRVQELRDQGMKDSKIAEGFGMSLTELRQYKTIALAESKQQQINQALKLQDKGLSNIAIGEKMGLNESSVRALTKAGADDKAKQLESIANMLKKQVDDKEFLDIGIEVERTLPLGDNPGAPIGVSKERFQTAVTMLREQGYEVHPVRLPQAGTGELTTYKVLTKPGNTQKDVWLNRHEIKTIDQQKSEDGGRTFPPPLRPPTSVSSKRVAIRYEEDGGAKEDGVIYIRPGAKDLDMGAARYAQVRIAVDGTHYLKGMAIYKDDMPKGVDLMFNTNKSKSVPKKHDDPDVNQVLKPMKRDKDGKIDILNPFEASIKEGGQRGHLNIIYEEGDWDKWKKNLPAQMLSKQDRTLAKQQLDMTYERRIKEFDEIKSLTNPAVRRKLLKSFSDETDSAAAHLRAAEMKGQATKVLLPIPSMKPHEIYAPTLRDGQRVALVRFPHGGTFEIPEVRVNNRNREARRIFGKGGAVDVVGINHKVAERLSGADFDGDSVLVIPNDRGQVRSTPALLGLKGFDPKRSYPEYPGMIRINAVKGRDQDEMGKITNLIQDMTIRGANNEDLARAVRHSMVIIDADKHNLDYKSSFRDNNIPQLKERYQGSKRAGASTLITKAGAETRIPERKPRPASEGGPIDRATGRKVFVETGRTYIDRKTGTPVRKKQRFKRLAVTEDARELLSKPTGTPIERVYADHSNRLKDLGNAARKEMVNTRNTPQSKSAKKVYAKEVESLNSKLNIARKNAPLERQAQVLTDKIYSEKRRANPDMDSDTKRKIRNQALAEARVRTRARKQRIELTPREWHAIQAGAVSNNMLQKILDNGNLDQIKELATPRRQVLMSSTMKTRAQSMLARGFTQAEVAQQLGVSLTTLKTGIG